MRQALAAVTLGGVILGAWLTGCAQGAPTAGSVSSAAEGFGDAAVGTTLGAPRGPTPTPSTPGTGGPSCVSGDASAPMLDPSELPECAPACGGAHCVPAANVPPGSSALFAACGAGFCVPDTLITSPNAKPPSCASLGSAAGVCLSVCVPEVAANLETLPQASCASDERCAPCVDPVSGVSTGACELGAPLPKCGTDAGSTPPAMVDAGPPPPLPCPYTGPPLLDPSMLPACAPGAHCLPSADVEPSEAPQFATCSGGSCVPDKLIETAGNFVPATCTSLGGAEGRCQSTALPAVAAQPGLPGSTCDANEVCVPCFDPLTQQDTGACHTSCDPGPTQPPVMLPSCCGGQATCVPSELIASSEQPFLSAAACSGGELCTPNENLSTEFHPEPCEDDYFGITWYTGVCLSNCLVLPDASDLYQGSCDGLHTCVPCVDPNSGQPTGAPGC